MKSDAVQEKEGRGFLPRRGRNALLAALPFACAIVLFALIADRGAGPSSAGAPRTPVTSAAACASLAEEEPMTCADTEAGGSGAPRAFSGPVYSASGYDITPLSREQVEKARARLTPEQDRIAFHAATEAPFCGLYTDASEPGIYASVVTGLPLFRSSAKFHSQSGWASFFEPIDPAHVVERVDSSHGMVRTEILEARAGAHLGHVFDDGPPPTGRRYCLNSAALVFYPKGAPLPPESRPVAVQTAYFAAGCFWGVEDSFARIPGVMDVVSGYMGGHAENPSYREVCAGGTGHAETVEVRFDPARISYARLLDAFFAMHDATSAGHGTDEAGQYRSAIFPADDEQAREAQAALARRSSDSSGKRPVRTRLERAMRFYPAEEYHQDYHARHRTRG